MVTAWLGPFEALCGFRPIAEIQFFIKGKTKKSKNYLENKEMDDVRLFPRRT